MKMSEEWKKYVDDPRSVCKYGASCYQKNPQHHSTFKHPPKRNKRKINTSPKRNTRPKTEPELVDQTESNVESKAENNTEISDKTETSLIENECLPTKQEHEISEVNTMLLSKTVSYYEADNYDLIKELFLVAMPKDFYDFFKCMKEEGSKAFEMLEKVNIELVGPFDLLLGKLPKVENKELYLVHWRFFYDPPEFQCVMKKKGKSEFHIGYFRDDPNEMPAFLASNDSAKDCIITPLATNIFGAITSYLQSEKKRSPFTAMVCQKFIDKVKDWAEKKNYTLEPFDMKSRKQKIVTRTLYGVGIVVPYNKKNQLGYRSLVENDTTLKKIFNNISNAKTPEEKSKYLSEIQPVITYASIAVDECDFGTGLEMGLDLFASGAKDLEQSSGSLLSSTYPLLKRDQFSTIIQAHLKYRRKGPEMSLLNIP